MREIDNLAVEVANELARLRLAVFLLGCMVVIVAVVAFIVFAFAVIA